MYNDMAQATDIAKGRLCHLRKRQVSLRPEEVFQREMWAEPVQAERKREDNISSQCEYGNATMTSPCYQHAVIVHSK